MKNNISQNLGRKIKLYRRQQKITLENLAKAINKSKSTVSKYENGEIVVDIENLYAISKALNTPIHCLLDDTDLDNGKYISFKNRKFPARQYFYVFKDRSNLEIAKSYIDLSIHEDKNRIVLYFMASPDDIKNPSYIYIGDAFLTDNTLSFIVVNNQSALDRMYFTASLPGVRQNGIAVGFWVGLSFESGSPVCMKAVISDHLIDDDEYLKDLLAVTDDEIYYFKRKARFLLRSEK